jgi:hypothetical protein
MLNKSKSLGLNIFGSSGNGITKAAPLYLQSHIASGNVNLYLKNNFNKSGILKANTNYDFSLVSPNRTNSYFNADIEFTWKDYSSNKFDSYYQTNRGGQAVNYSLSANWNVTDIAAEDEIMAIGTSDWTSFEKYTADLGSNPALYSAYIAPVTLYPIPPPTLTTYTVYTFYIDWDTHTGNHITSAGDLTINYNYMGNSMQSITHIVNNDNNNGTNPPPLQSTTWPPTYSWTGSPSDWADQYFPPAYTTSTVTVVTPATLPTGAVTVGNYYFVPDSNTFRLSKFMIPGLSLFFQDPTQNWMNFNSPDFEVPDYSDIYIDVLYNPTGTNDSTHSNVVTSSSTANKTYQFGGFIRFSDFINGLFDKTITSQKTNIDDDVENLWYIVVNDDGTYSHIGLSSWIYFDWLGNVNFNDFPEYSSTFLPSNYLVADWKIINITTINIYKTAAFPNCGKVDLYTIKKGVSTSLSGDTIKSPNHGLSNGQRVKITGGLSSGTADASVTNVNALWYAKVLDTNYFQLYSDPTLTMAANIANVRNPSGLSWVAIEGDTWKYTNTIYSPNGKNGYGFNSKLRTSFEPDSTEEDPILRAVSSDIYDDGYLKPQADFKGMRSWNNFYPFQRFGTSAEIALNIVNGNKFGTSVSIKKYNNDYILMVTEPGAFESFQIADEFILTPNQAVPNNQKVIPIFFPYGRVHFYKIYSDYSVEYITSFSTNDNPWIAYEAINRQEKLLNVHATFQNSALTNNYAKIYNTTTSNYWANARFFGWQKDYTYNTTAQMLLPDQNSSQLEYGFVDSLGKGGDFEIDNGTVYGFVSTNVKDSDYLNNARISSMNMVGIPFSFSLASPATKTSSSIVFQSSYSTSDHTLQQEEIEVFGTTVIAKNNKLFVGWPSIHRDSESISYFSRSGTSYSLQQILTSDGNNGFGEYFVSDGIFLITNKYHLADENNILTTNPLSSIDVYRHNGPGDIYTYDSSFTPTIDVTNPIYNNINQDLYEMTTNRSYDNTSDNSATYIIDLSNRYDFRDGILVLKDWYEYAGFQYNWSTKSFQPKFHNFSNVSSAQSVVRLTQPRSAALYDSSGTYDTGQYSESLNIIDAAQSLDTSLLNYTLVSDMQAPNGLPLYLKTIDGYSSGNMNFYILPHDSFASGVNLYTQGPIPKSGNIPLFLEMYNPASGGINLFHKSTSLSSGNLSLYTKDYIVTGSMPMYIDNGHLNSTLPLILYWPVYPAYNVRPLYVENYHTQSPNSSGSLNLYMQPLPSAVFSAGMALVVNPTGSDGYIYSSDTTVPLYMNGANTFGNLNLYNYSSGNQVYNQDSYFPLFIRCPITAEVPLFVYNTNMIGDISMYASGANVFGSGLNLFCSGVDGPRSETMSIFIPGDL